ncbi:MAG: hypothetical protein HY078_01505 [Elusimicrobia bacterium]|nr:hypothetical protein [Elusimicrobiota bacterium]
MAYYIRFMLCLSTGIIGVCMVLKTLLDTLFADWNIAEDIMLLLSHPDFWRHPERKIDYQALMAASHQQTAKIEGQTLPIAQAAPVPASGTAPAVAPAK